MEQDVQGSRSIDLCSADEVWEGAGVRVVVPGLPPLAVFNLEGEFFVIDDTCTHGNASLADGFVEDGHVECMFHGGRFCIRTGAVCGGPVDVAVKSYPVQLVDGRVRVVGSDFDHTQ